ncbi:MAG TPA: sulfatase [Vicinamibacteria bacterium]|nr:sulfatase [Vicinamibacteria bacterium]
MLVSLDTLRADRLNCYGYRARPTSPEIDRLAADALLFENHVTASPWTTPAHLSLLTSLAPSSHGVITPFLEAQGELALGRGFACLGAEHATLAEVLSRNGYASAAMTGGVTLDPRLGFGRGFELYDTGLAKLGAAAVQQMAGWIAQHGNSPFFLFLHTFEVHAPYTRATYLGSVLPQDQAAALRRALGRLERRPDVSEAALRGEHVLARHKALTLDVASALYDGGVHEADSWVGELVAVLKRERVYDRTMLIVTSDHGEQLGESSAGLAAAARDGAFYNRHGHDLYQELLHVPLIVRLPGGLGVRGRVAAVTRAIDVMPTILDVLGVPAGSARMQGVSLRPLWEGREPAGRLAFAEALAAPGESKAVRDARYKYIVSASPAQVAAGGRARLPAEPAAVELYDLQSDPAEQHNLVSTGDPEIRRQAKALDRALRRIADAPSGRADRMAPSQKLIEDLRLLGYMR